MDISYRDGRQERELHDTPEGMLDSLQEIFEQAEQVQEVRIAPLIRDGDANLSRLFENIGRLRAGRRHLQGGEREGADLRPEGGGS